MRAGMQKSREKEQARLIAENVKKTVDFYSRLHEHTDYGMLRDGREETAGKESSE